MVVITLTACPVGLRGDLTKWLLEIKAGVFVGDVNARVRDAIWDKICDVCKTGQAILAYSTNTEQGVDFRTHGYTWEPVSYDGLKLILRKAPETVKTSDVAAGYSNASHFLKAKRAQNKRNGADALYVVVDVETTGLDTKTAEIIELGAVKVKNGNIIGTFESLVKPMQLNPDSVTALTGIENGQATSSISEVMPKFLDFVGRLPMAAHNASFDYDFIRAACKVCELPMFSNRYIDTFSLAKKLVKGVKNYKLKTLLEWFHIETESEHRSLADCKATKLLYDELIKLQGEE